MALRIQIKWVCYWRWHGYTKHAGIVDYQWR